MKNNPTSTFGGAKAPPDGGRFARCLGAFIMNCGVLEFHTYTWMIGLSPKLELPPKTSALSWSERVSWIRRKLKDAKMDRALRSEVRRELDVMQDMYELRNIVAHGPMMWHHNEDGLLVGFVPSVKKSLEGKPTKIVEFADIEAAISTSGNLYPRLRDLRDRVLADLGVQAPPFPDDTSAPTNPKS
jgi:hypothetical protein